MKKTALVTGAASGLGEAIARRLSSDGMTVIVADIDETNGAAVADDLGGEAAFMALDVRQESAWLSMLEHVQQRYGSLQVLVNNAGITTMGSIEDLSFEAFQNEIAVDLCGVFLGCKHALPLMKSKGGSIINIASAASIKPNEDLAGYNAVKAAVAMLTKSVALHCAKSGYDIRANSVHPGVIHTPILDKVMAQVDDPKTLMDGFVAAHPIGRIGQPSEVAGLVSYLASDEAAFATASEFVLDGGMSL